MTNKLCPDCRNPMNWQEGLLDDGVRDMTVGRYYCDACHLFMKQTESRAIRKGMNLAKKLEGVHCMDKRITRYSSAIQIGILRELQPLLMNPKEK